MNEKTIEVWITKYALTTGIEKWAVRKSAEFPSMVTANLAYFHKPHWHETKEEAIAQAEQMRLKKIASLKKQITKLEALKFQ